MLVQLSGVPGVGKSTLAGWQQQPVRPETDCLVVDAERPTAGLLPEVVAYRRGSGKRIMAGRGGLNSSATDGP